MIYVFMIYLFNKLLAEHTLKHEVHQLLPKEAMETIFMDTINVLIKRINHSILLNFSQRLDLRSSNKHNAFQKFPICYTWENIRQQYKNNKLKIIAPTQNEEFEFPEGSYSVSDIQDYFVYIRKKHEALPVNLFFIFTFT